MSYLAVQHHARPEPTRAIYYELQPPFFAYTRAKKKKKRKAVTPPVDAAAASAIRVRRTVDGLRKLKSDIDSLSGDKQRRARGFSKTQNEFHTLLATADDIIAAARRDGPGGAWEKDALGLIAYAGGGEKKLNYGILRWTMISRQAQARKALRDGDQLRQQKFCS